MRRRQFLQWPPPGQFLFGSDPHQPEMASRFGCPPRPGGVCGVFVVACPLAHRFDACVIGGFQIPLEIRQGFPPHGCHSHSLLAQPHSRPPPTNDSTDPT